jgi:hypothetical protein
VILKLACCEYISADFSHLFLHHPVWFAEKMKKQRIWSQSEEGSYETSHNVVGPYQPKWFKLNLQRISLNVISDT